jgi:hypothetical protein
MTAAPELSVILMTLDRYESIRRTVAWLRVQNVVDAIELVIIAPSREALDLDESELAVFHSHQVVEVGPVRFRPLGNAIGVRVAKAPVVVFSEDHVCPQPGWAEALIARHREPWAVVGPVFDNGNPRSAISWADFLPGYGPWLDPLPGGEASYLAGHNSSYKRDVLLEFDDELEQVLSAEAVLHWELGKRGHKLYLEPKAKTRHYNYSRLPIYLWATFLHARVFASERARGGRWGPLRRLGYAGAWPLIPLVRLRRVFRDVGRARGRGVFPRVLPPVVLGLTVSALGEAAGYLLGPGDAPDRVSGLEFKRDRYVTRRDRAEMARALPG